MYPRISDLINDIFGTEILLPAKTFGFFLALAFIAAYIPLRADLKRREGLGHYRRKMVKVMVQGPIHIRDVVIHGLLWGLVAYKLGYYFIDPDLFNNDTEAALLSSKGFWLTGLIGAAAGAGLKYLEYAKKKNLEVKYENVLAGPSFYLGTVVTIAFVAGILGSKLFAMLEPGSNFWRDPIADLMSFNGLSFFGGLLCAGALIIIYLYRKGFDILTSVDAFAPGLILAYGVGRIGCQMSGDGDWGITNVKPKPGFLSWLPDWMWAYDYPHNVAMDGVPIPGAKMPGCNGYGEYCMHLAQPAYPTPIYETLMALAIFGFLWAIRKKMKHPGQVTAIWMMLIGIERFAIEKIRVNTTYNFVGLHFTQAELISFFLLVGGAAILFYSMRAKKELVVEKK
jgi:phosphatidylglycerol---prolipoprotein diacylglyceryl transferase